LQVMFAPLSGVTNEVLEEPEQKTI